MSSSFRGRSRNVFSMPTSPSPLFVRALAPALALVPLLSTNVFSSRARVLWFLAAAALVIVVALGVPATTRALATRPAVWAVWASAAIAFSFLLGLMVHLPPTQLGVQYSAAAIAGLVLAGSISATRSDFRNAVVAPLLAAAAFQGLLMSLQLLTDRPLLLEWTSDFTELPTIDGLVRGLGTMRHPFQPAFVATVAISLVAIAIADDERRDWRWTAPVALATVAIGVSYSRSALLGCLLLLGVVGAIYVSRRSGGALVLGTGILAGLLVSGAIAGAGWFDKLGGSFDDDLDDASSGRWTLIEQAWPVIVDHPLLGVGPGKYQDVLDAEYEYDERYPYNAHFLPIHAAAELGIPAAATIVALLVLTGVQAFRVGSSAAAAFLAMVPWMLFDILYFDQLVSLVVFAVWLGGLGWATAQSRHTSLVSRSS